MAFGTEEGVADAADGAGDDQLEIGVDGTEGQIGYLFDSVGDFIAGLAELNTGKEQFLAVFAVGHVMFVESEIIVVFVIDSFIRQCAIIEGFPLSETDFRCIGLEHLPMVAHAIGNVEMAETAAMLQGIRRDPDGAILNTVLRNVGYLDDGVARWGIDLVGINTISGYYTHHRLETDRHGIEGMNQAGHIVDVAS